jgi:FMN reductase
MSMTVEDSGPLSVVAVSGSLQSPSKTTTLVRAIAEAVAARREVQVRVIEIEELGPRFAGALRRDELPPEAEEALTAIEQADLLIVGSPVYRASFTGLFKHVFDFVGQYALVGKPVLLSATGGSDRHALTIEHQLRPLFGFFQALTLPLGVYGSDGDFTDYRVTSTSLQERIGMAVDRAIPLLELRVAQSHPSSW